jgi:gamma-glutamylputrescine oxidase
MNISYWEEQHFFRNIDFCITGGGIVGLNTALHLRKAYPRSRILVLERALTGAAASSKNAGFACFGSVSEILDDISSSGEETAFSLINMRWEGLQLLRKTLGKERLGFRRAGGYELFTDNDGDSFTKCAAAIHALNKETAYIGKKVYRIVKTDAFGFKGVRHIIENRYEGQVNTASMYFNLEKKCISQDIIILRGFGVKAFQDHGPGVTVQLDNNYELNCRKLLISNNGFARQLIREAEVEPARAQVLVTEPIPGLELKGTFHYDKGYYYFRNIDNRILIGGGRHNDMAGENTFDQQVTPGIQQHIERLLFDVVLGREVKIDTRWAGTMGVGASKFPIIRELSGNVYCGVRMGGMGIAIGSLVGKKLAALAG